MISATCGLVDALCFLALGGVFAEMMTGNLLLMALSIGTGGALGQTARYIPAIVAFALGALIGGRLLRAPQRLQERRIGFAVEWVVIIAATALTCVAEPNAHNLTGHGVVAMLALAGIQSAMLRVHGVPDTWRAPPSCFLLKFGTGWPLVLTSSTGRDCRSRGHRPLDHGLDRRRIEATRLSMLPVLARHQRDRPSQAPY